MILEQPGMGRSPKRGSASKWAGMVLQRRSWILQAKTSGRCSVRGRSVRQETASAHSRPEDKP